MTLPEYSPVARQHGLNMNRIGALLELFKNGETDAHGQTLKSLRRSGLVTRDKQLTFAGVQVAKSLADLNANGDDEDETKDSRFGEWCDEHQEEMQDHVHEDEMDASVGPNEAKIYSDVEEDEMRISHEEETDSSDQPLEPASDEPEDMPAHKVIEYDPNVFHNVTEESDTVQGWMVAQAEAPHRATYSVVCRPRRSGGSDHLVAIVVGTEEEAQHVADRWNLDHLAEIAAHADATYAVVTKADAAVYLFDTRKVK